MPKVTDITVLNIDEKPYAVESLSDEVKALVDIYNEWNRKEADVRDELTRFQAAKETLSRQIIGKVREGIAAEEAAAVAAAEAETATTEAPAEEAAAE
jgi:predicted  nucleic acid-binding Zn-ribbon protein